MNKEAFLTELRQKLSGLPPPEREERISFYREMIEDRMEDGLTEEEATAGIGTVDEVVEEIMADIPLTLLVREKVKPKRTRPAWKTVLLMVGSPVWVPLLIAFAAVVLSLYVSLWAVVISLWAADLSLAAGALCGLAGAVMYLGKGNPAGALFVTGGAAVCAGLAILLFFGCREISKGVLRLQGRMVLGAKTSMAGKEA